jgi:hypothetical protein
MLTVCSHTKVSPPSQKQSTATRELVRFYRELIDGFSGSEPVVLKRNHHFPFVRVMSPEVEWSYDPSPQLVDFFKLRATGGS